MFGFKKRKELEKRVNELEKFITGIELTKMLDTIVINKTILRHEERQEEFVQALVEHGKDLRALKADHFIHIDAVQDRFKKAEPCNPRIIEIEKKVELLMKHLNLIFKEVDKHTLIVDATKDSTLDMLNKK